MFKLWNALLERDPLVAHLLGFVVALFASWMVYRIAKRVLIRAIERFARRSAITWDDALVERGVFNRIALLAPTLVIFYVAHLVPLTMSLVIQRLLTAYIAAVMFLAVGALVNALGDIYNTTKIAKDFPLKGYLQTVKIALYVIGGIVVLAIAFDRSPWVFLSGLGAMTAVLLLIFKDTLLSFVASIQIASLDMLRIGDNIEAPALGIDGEVKDIALHTVTIQSSDKTLTHVPTYKLIETAFKNWRGMNQAGVRRIKRSILIDQSSIAFLTDTELRDLERIWILTEALRTEREAIGDAVDTDAPHVLNQRRITNLRVLRTYLVRYLKAHPKVRADLPVVVRQLEPSRSGLPFEVFAYVTETAWVGFEEVQTDIFEHILAAVPFFGLSLFQDPTGHDRPASSPLERRVEQ